MGNLLSHVQFLDFSEALGFQIEEIIPSLDGYTQYVEAPATITLLNGELTITGNTTGFAETTLRRLLQKCRTLLTWDKKQILEFYAYFHRKADPDNEIYVRRGEPDLLKQGFGFHTQNDGLYGHVGDDANYTELKLKDEGPGAWNDQGIYKAVLIPGYRVEFYIDGALAGIITTNLPSGVDAWTNIFCAYVGPGGADPHELNLYGFRYFQGQ